MIFQYWHTIRYLRWVQIYDRLKRKVNRPIVDCTPAGKLREQIGCWVVPARYSKRMESKRSFCFLNKSHELGPVSDWNNPQWSKLWLYNLHYFDDLVAFDSASRREWHCVLIQRWIDENLVGVGNGWEPYPSSLRIVNWIKWSIAGNRLEEAWADSLVLQVRFLAQNLEFHLFGNHLFANAKALVFAGIFFEGDEALGWYKRGLQLIEQELPEQVLSDGANFELTTMYHMIFLQDLLDLVNIHRAYGYDVPHDWEETIENMVNWLVSMCHPDGEISFFNDAAIGNTPSVSEILNYVGRLALHKNSFNQNDVYEFEQNLVEFKQSGYTRAVIGNAVLLVDRAAVGPDYIPGHAHADSLSFELSLFGQRVVVNSGTSVYGTGSDRQQERGTAAHSTVVVDGENSSEVWGGFRVARRARIVDYFTEQEQNLIYLSACHNGYARLHGKPKHCREWRLEDGCLTICDRVSGKGVHEVSCVLPLHPDVSVGQIEKNQALLTVADKQVVVDVEGDGNLEQKVSSYHPEFGLSIDNAQLVYRSSGALPIEITTRIHW